MCARIACSFSTAASFSHQPPPFSPPTRAHICFIAFFLQLESDHTVHPASALAPPLCTHKGSTAPSPQLPLLSQSISSPSHTIPSHPITSHPKRRFLHHEELQGGSWRTVWTVCPRPDGRSRLHRRHRPHAAVAPVDARRRRRCRRGRRRRRRLDPGPRHVLVRGHYFYYHCVARGLGMCAVGNGRRDLGLHAVCASSQPPPSPCSLTPASQSDARCNRLDTAAPHVCRTPTTPFSPCRSSTPPFSPTLRYPLPKHTRNAPASGDDGGTTIDQGSCGFGTLSGGAGTGRDVAALSDNGARGGGVGGAVARRGACCRGAVVSGKKGRWGARRRCRIDTAHS